MKSKEEIFKSLVDGFWAPVNFKGWVESSIKRGIEQYIEFSGRGSMLKFVKSIKENINK